MKSSFRLQLTVTVIGLALTAFGPVRAQNAAADMIRNSMAAAGVTSGFSVKSGSGYAEYKSRGSAQEFRGLRLSMASAKADSGPGWGLISVVENLSNRPYCIRPKTQGLPSGEDYRVQTVNQIVEPGKTLMIIGIRDSGYSAGFSTQTTFAFWPPNYDAPNGSWCRSNAPEGLQDWLDASDVTWFPGSRRD